VRTHFRNYSGATFGSWRVTREVGSSREYLVWEMAHECGAVIRRNTKRLREYELGSYPPPKCRCQRVKAVRKRVPRKRTIRWGKLSSNGRHCRLCLDQRHRVIGRRCPGCGLVAGELPKLRTEDFNRKTWEAA
jgi:hypothetical protein